MFDNIGKKIKTLANVVCCIGIVASIIGGGICIVIGATNSYNGGSMIATGIAVLLLGSLSSWIGSFVLYGFGEMVENSDIRTELMVKADMEKANKEKSE